MAAFREHWCLIMDTVTLKKTAMKRERDMRIRVFCRPIYLFIIKSYTKYTTDRHTVRTMKAVEAALNTNTRQNIVY